MIPDRTLPDRNAGAFEPDAESLDATALSNLTGDRPTDATALGTIAVDVEPPAAADLNGATASFDAGSATPPPSGPPSVSRRPLPTVPGYVVHGVLGRGGMGVVYRATQAGLNRQVALKMVLAGGHASGPQLDRFTAEARAIAHVKHPHIVQVYEIGEHDGLPYFSLELCPGGSLDKTLNHEPQAAKTAANMVEKLARAMAAAHAAGVIHRDLKPANVLLDEHGEPKVTDFGLARALDAEDGQTRTGSILGTPSYMAPEQARGENHRVGPASDQYSLGATLYDLLTGRPPFKGTSVVETLEQVRNRDPLPPRTLVPGCPKDLETICLKALAKEPEKRYATCGEMADDLRAFQEGRPIAARPVSRAEKAWRWARRNPGVAVPSAVAALLLVATAVLGTAFAVVFDRQKAEAVQLAGNLQVALDSAEEARKQEAVQRQTADARRKEADAANDLTQSALQRVGVDAPTALKKSAYAAKARGAVLDVIAGVLAGQLDPTNSRRLPERARLQYHLALGDLLFARTGGKAAEAEYKKAIELAEPLAAGGTGRAKGTLAQALLKQATAADAQGRTADGAALTARAVSIMREAVDDPAAADIPRADRLRVLASGLTTSADRNRRGQKFAVAEAELAEAIGLLAEATADPAVSDPTAALVQSADARRDHGLVLAKLGKDAEAEAELRAAVAEHQRLVDADRAARKPDDAHTLALAAAVSDLGDFLLMRNKLADAAPFYVQLIDLHRGLTADPEVLAQRQRLSQAYYRAGVLGEKKNGRGKGLPFFKLGRDVMTEVAGLMPAGSPAHTRARLQVALFAARAGDHAAAAKELPAIIGAAKSPTEQANLRLDAAGVLGVAAAAADHPAVALAPPAAALAEKYRAAAFAHLDFLVGPQVGYADAVRLRTDPDFDALRPDRRFAAVVERAEANAAARARK